MTSPYYVFDDKPLRFAVLDQGRPVFPRGATVQITNPIGSLVKEDRAVVKMNTIEYTVPGAVHDEAGEYTASIPVTFRNGKTKTHEIKYRIEARPSSEKDEMPQGDTVDLAEEKSAVFDVEHSWENINQLVKY